MSKEDIIKKLRSPKIKQQLMDAGMVHLWLFGSYAHGTATEESDIDLLYEYDALSPKKNNRGFRSAYSIIEQNLLKPIDMIGKSSIDPLIKDNVLSSLVSIY